MKKGAAFLAVQSQQNDTQKFVIFFREIDVFLRKAPIQKRRRRRKAVAIRICPSSNHVSCSESAIKIYGSKEEFRARKSPETVDAPGFAPDASIPVTLYGAVGGIRTLGRLLAVTRFPVVLVMTTSIPLRISMLNSKHHYTKIGREVNTQFSLFRKKRQENRRAKPDGRFLIPAAPVPRGRPSARLPFCCAPRRARRPRR